MCLFSSVPVRGKLGLAHGAAGLALPGFDPLRTGSVLALSHVPARLEDAGMQQFVGGMQAAGLGSRRVLRWGGQASVAAGRSF